MMNAPNNVGSATCRPQTQNTCSRKTPVTQKTRATLFTKEGFKGGVTKITALNENAEPVGFGEILCVLESADIIDVEVSENFRRRGIGREICERLIAAAAESGVEVITLEARVSNVAARTLYKSLGFREISVRERYYGDGEDAVIMQKRLWKTRINL